jgi:O-acetyl-ADP-ribose deacetylase (regulator of RNase III)
MRVHVGNTDVEIIHDDITTIDADAIVNPANDYLWMGGGISTNIKSAGGEEIERESLSKGPVLIGEAVVTGAGKLSAKYVIHAVIMGQDLKTDEEKIHAAVLQALEHAERLPIVSIAIPSMCEGGGGSTISDFKCAQAMIKGIIEFLIDGRSLEKVVIAPGESAYDSFARVLKDHFSLHHPRNKKRSKK